MTYSAKEKYLQYLDIQEGYDIYNEFKSFLYGEADSLVQKIYEDVLYPTLIEYKGPTFTLCDIGGGDGKRIVALLSRAHRDFPELHFELEFIEPSKSAFVMANNNFDDIKSFVSIASQNIIFEKAAPGSRKFDLILLIHSIFTFSKDENIFRIKNLKNDQGKVLVVANHPDSLMKKLNSEMHKRFDEKRYELTNFFNDLERSDIKYDRTDKVTEFLIPKTDFENFSDTVLTWASMGEYADFSESIKMKCKNYLKDLASSSDDSNYYYQEKEVFLLIK